MEGLHLYLKVVQVFRTENIQMVYYYVFGWGKQTSYKVQLASTFSQYVHERGTKTLQTNVFGDSEVFLCPTLVTRRKNFFLISIIVIIIIIIITT